MREQVAAVFMRTGYFDKYTKKAPIDVIGRWSQDEIATMVHLDIITGYEDGTFRPKKNITWGELFTMIAKFNSLRVEKRSNNDHWSKEYAKAVIESGINLGFELTSENLNKTVTRGEFINIMNIILDRHPEPETIIKEANPFKDLRETDKYYVDVMEATITHKYKKEVNKSERWGR